MDRPLVYLEPEDPPEVSALRFLAHMEAGHQVIFVGPGGVFRQPWWRDVEGRVTDILRDREMGLS